MASCTYVSHVHAINGAWATENSSAYAGSATGYYYTTKITFKTPSFSGTPGSITFKLAMSQFVGTSVNLRYAICSSDANKASYCNTFSAVSDANLIIAGTANITGLTTGLSASELYKEITINASELASNKTYYLFLWSSTSEATNPKCVVIQPQGAYLDANTKVNHTISITVGSGGDGGQSGLVYIDNGTSFEAYQVYIYNGSGWDLYIPYIDNGSGWDAY